MVVLPLPPQPMMAILSTCRRFTGEADANRWTRAIDEDSYGDSRQYGRRGCGWWDSRNGSSGAGTVGAARWGGCSGDRVQVAMRSAASARRWTMSSRGTSVSMPRLSAGPDRQAAGEDGLEQPGGELAAYGVRKVPAASWPPTGG